MRNALPTLLPFALLRSCKSETTTIEETTDLDRAWWKERVLYQIYPQSSQDTDGDGFGDFPGVIQRLDYLESLGIGMVWMNPFFESPLVDNGYDVADYTAILPRYGTMADFDAMLEDMQEHDIKFVLDVVVNHSSDQHRWFQEASQSRDSEYFGYYYWWPAEKGVDGFRLDAFQAVVFQLGD